MAQRIEFTLKMDVHYQQAVAALHELPTALARSVIERALLRAAEPIARQATINLRWATGAGLKSKRDLRGLAANSLRRTGVQIKTRLSHRQAAYRAARYGFNRGASIPHHYGFTGGGWRYDASTSDVAVFIGPTARTGHLIEWGTKARWTKGRMFAGYRQTIRGGKKRIYKSGGRRRYTGRVTPRPYLTPAWDWGKARAAESIGVELWRALEHKARQIASKQQRIISRIE